MQRIELRDGTWLQYDRCFFTPEEDAHWLTWLQHAIPWTQEGRPGRRFPRLTAWYADPGLVYRYSGVKHIAQGWLPELLVLKDRLEQLSGHTWNSLLLNYYRDGQDSIGMHADDEPELGPLPVVGSISFGASRHFVLRHVDGATRQSFPLGGGAALIMAGTCQQYYRHGIAKTKKPVGARINLTFRRIV